MVGLQGDKDTLLKISRGSGLLVWAGVVLWIFALVVLLVFQIFEDSYDFNIDPNHMFGPWGNLYGIVYLSIIGWLVMKELAALPEEPGKAGIYLLISTLFLSMALIMHIRQADFIGQVTSGYIVFWPYYNMVLVLSSLVGCISCFILREKD